MMGLHYTGEQLDWLRVHYPQMPEALKASVLALSKLEIAAGDWQGTKRHTGPRKKRDFKGQN